MRRSLSLSAFFAVVAAFIAIPAGLQAQSLSERFTQLYTFGNCGQPMCLNVDVAGEHGAHFIPAVTQGEHDLLAFITGSLSTSLGNLPFTAATGGVAFQFIDGALVATSASSGGIFGDRSQTIGEGKFLIGASIHSLTMDRLRGMPMSDMVSRFAHQNVGAAPMGDPVFENDIIEVRTNMKVGLTVTSVYASYGLTRNIDVGVLLPFVRASLSGHSEAQIFPYDRPNPHFFGTATSPSEYADASSSGSAVGVGDVGVRVKANLYQTPTFGAAVAADVRLPTGDSANFLGSGNTSVRVMGVVSGKSGGFSPHLNAGFVYRSGSTQTSSVAGAVGFDHLLADKVTLAVDILADWALGETGLELPEPVVYTAPTTRRVRLTDLPDMRDHLLDASVGIKMQLPGDYRLVTNLLMPMSDGGLRPRQMWTLGFERTY